jgi:hypothetical protein
MDPHRRMEIYIGFQSPSILKYLEPLTSDLFTAWSANCIFNEDHVLALGGDNKFITDGWSAGNGGVTTGSPTAEVHRQDYAEHEHLHTHSPGTYTTAGSSRDDETSEAATAHRRRGGSTSYNASLASGTEGKRPEGCGIAASDGDWTRAQGGKLSPVMAVGEDREAAGWRF